MLDTKKVNLTEGRIVYVLGRHRAEVVKAYANGSVMLDVYEGLAPGDKAPWRGTYGKGLAEAEKRKT